MRVVILGAGPAGASAAATLAARRIDTVVVDPRGGLRRPLGETLPAAAADHLSTLGVWEAFRQDGHLQCSGFASCWGNAEPQYRSAITNPYGPSWQLDRTRFNAMLQRAAATAGAGEPLPWRLTGAAPHPDGWSLTFHNPHGGTGQKLTAGFVIDGTGRHSQFARSLGVRRRVHSRLVGVVGLLEDPRPHDAQSLVETVEQGWWYASRVPGGRLAVALFTDGAIANDLGLTTESRWSQLLSGTALIRDRAGWPHQRLVAPLHTAAAGSSRLPSPDPASGWLAVGDAAYAHEPLASRGLYDALASGIAGAEAIIQSIDGDPDALARHTGNRDRAYDRYLLELSWFYQQERRFPGAPFWQARAAITAQL
jgi:flavin-dependent dehydrogenase